MLYKLRWPKPKGPAAASSTSSAGGTHVNTAAAAALTATQAATTAGLPPALFIAAPSVCFTPALLLYINTTAAIYAKPTTAILLPLQQSLLFVIQ
jgi:hypothetical protein